VLEVQGLCAGYDGTAVLHGVSLRVGPGEVAIVLGPNGHGKSTLLRAISGLLRPTAGRITLDNRSLHGARPELIAAAGIVHVPQGDRLFPDMTVKDNLLTGAYLAPAWRERRARLDRVFALFPRLGERLGQLAGTLSGGERRMLAIGRGLMASARVLLIDEPSLGLSPALREQVYTAIGEIKRSGLAVLLCDENADHAAVLGDRVYLMEGGWFLREGPAAAMLADRELLSVYLG
jgi:branched-chain amino acid transport system ATP-binding protein